MLEQMKSVVAAGAVAVALAVSGPAAGEVPESKDPIKLTLHDWTGQYVTVNIMKRVLEELGYNVELVQADYIAQFAGLESGDLHVAMEMWETTGKQAMDASLATGKTIDLGETGMDAKEEWWYPIYMKEKCPGLPDWKALNDCAEAFSTPETHPKGRYLGGPVTWAGFDDERAEALGLDYEVVHAGTDAALFAELESAYQRKSAVPRLGLRAPLGAGQVRGRVGRVSRVHRRVLRRPELGHPTPTWPTTAASRSAGSRRSAGRAARKWPCAYEAVRNFRIDNQAMGALIIEVDLEGKPVDDVVAELDSGQRGALEARMGSLRPINRLC